MNTELREFLAGLPLIFLPIALAAVVCGIVVLPFYVLKWLVE